jgi:hypothetical protein
MTLCDVYDSAPTRAPNHGLSLNLLTPSCACWIPVADVAWRKQLRSHPVIDAGKAQRGTTNRQPGLNNRQRNNL